MRLHSGHQNAANTYRAGNVSTHGHSSSQRQTQDNNSKQETAASQAGNMDLTQILSLLKELISLLQGVSGSNVLSNAPDVTNNVTSQGRATSKPDATQLPKDNSPSEFSSSDIKLGVPSYNYPDSKSFWNQVQNAKPGSIFILNPNSGPGDKADPNFKAAVEAAHAKGVKIYGYVSTQYGDRSQSAVQQDIDAYRSMYGVDGIFLDEAALDKNHLPYDKSISDDLHNAGLEVSANPGQPDIDPGAVEFTDHIMNFEGSYDDYLNAKLPEWTKDVSPDKFWNVIYEAPSDVNFKELLNTAAKHHAGYIYATDDGGANPWDEVPEFFCDEMNLTA